MGIEETDPVLTFVFSKKILEKLQDKHDGVTKSEVIECFDNSDDRSHPSYPPDGNRWSQAM